MRHIYIGTKEWKDRHIVKDVVYVQNEENGELWILTPEHRSANVVDKTIKKLKKYFDEWTDLGTIPDGVRIDDVLKTTHRYERIV